LHGIKEQQSLSRAALETLAIIAYRQPITRADLEAIRGVACGEVLRSILEKKLIDIVGRAEELGRPMLYGTTKRFLESFGLASIKDLPNHQDFAPPITSSVEKKPGAKPTNEESQPS
jgi:segregation and condensation protein B